MRKYKLIEKTFAIKIKHKIIPSIESKRKKANRLSMIPKSFENLLLSRPLGVMSKYEQGLIVFLPLILSIAPS